MHIPLGYAQINVVMTGGYVPNGAQVAYGVHLDNPAMTPLDVATQAALHWGTEIAENLTNAVIATAFRVKFGPNEDGGFAEYATNIPGSQGGNPLPPGVSFLVHKVTNFGGRRGRGRMYLPGIDEAAVDGAGLITGARTGALAADLATWMAAHEASDIPLVLLHGADADGTPPPVLPYPITGMNVSSTVATQRRRQRR